MLNAAATTFKAESQQAYACIADLDHDPQTGPCLMRARDVKSYGCSVGVYMEMGTELRCRLPLYRSHTCIIPYSCSINGHCRIGIELA